MKQTRSKQLYQRALQCMPGGVNSPVRAFKSVGQDPFFVASAKGPYVYDVDGHHFIDYVGSWGPMILGHADETIVTAMQQAVTRGVSYGIPNVHEVELAELLCQLMPTIESVRMVSSGTEATMSAIRLARAYTQRNKIIKFEGCYHGHSDALLVAAGSGALTYGVPSSPGVPAATVADTLVARFNDLDSVVELFATHEDIAAIIVEPIAGNMNCVFPRAEFLPGLRRLCDKYGALLIVDEVMTGFRVALGGAQSLYQVKPDLTTLGKVIGGGFPVAAFGGRADIMSMMSPQGNVYQAGTLSGNPLGMLAGLLTLQRIQQAGFYEQLGRYTQQLVQGLQQRAQHYGIPLRAVHQGGMFGLFFTDQAAPIEYYEQVKACDSTLFVKFFQAMLAQGSYFAPSPFEAGFVSITHTEQVIAQTLTQAEQVFAGLAAENYSAS